MLKTLQQVSIPKKTDFEFKWKSILEKYSQPRCWNLITDKSSSNILAELSITKNLELTIRSRRRLLWF